MNKRISGPKGRRSIPDELMQFGKHLVYSEGTKTEPNYVNSIKQAIVTKYNCAPNDIKLVNVDTNGSKNTLGLVEYMINDVKQKVKEDRINHVWVMFDKDDFPQDKFDNAIHKIEELNDSKEKNDDSFNYNTKDGISYHCCYSNEAFELWLLCHFEYCDAKQNRDAYNRKLSSYLQMKYDKTIENIHQKIIEHGGSIDNAIKFAKKLTENNNTNNPSTKMYLFLEYFRAYMKK